MALNMPQQITIAALTITYDNDGEAVRRASRHFNVLLHGKECESFMKLLMVKGIVICMIKL